MYVTYIYTHTHTSMYTLTIMRHEMLRLYPTNLTRWNLYFKTWFFVKIKHNNNNNNKTTTTGSKTTTTRSKTTRTRSKTTTRTSKNTTTTTTTTTSKTTTTTTTTTQFLSQRLSSHASCYGCKDV